VRALDLSDLTKKLVRKAGEWAVPVALREDLAQGALVALAQGAGAWDPVEDPSGWRFVVKAMSLAWGAEKKRRARRRTDSDTDAVEQAPPSSDRGPARLVIDGERAKWATERLLAAFERSPLTLAVVRLCLEEGELTPATLAARLDEPLERIYDCKRRIAKEVKQLQEAWQRREQKGGASE
jgi:DNA-directed RNA polymerase specialized sigma24 family protein